MLRAVTEAEVFPKGGHEARDLFCSGQGLIGRTPRLYHDEEQERVGRPAGVLLH